MKKRHKKWYINHKEENGIVYRKCTKCNEWFIEDDKNFHLLNKSYPEKGFMANCKVCTRRISLARRNMNIESEREAARIYYYNNKERRLKEIKESRRIREEHFREYMQNYQKENPDKLRQYREKRKIKDHTITKEEWAACKNYFDNSCAYCGLKHEDHWVRRKSKLINMDLHKEHVDDKGCGDLENCVPACSSCNGSKHTAKLDEWYNENNPNYNQDRYDKIIKWIAEDYQLYIKPKQPKGKYIKDINNPRWNNCI